MDMPLGLVSRYADHNVGPCTVWIQSFTSLDGMEQTDYLCFTFGKSVEQYFGIGNFHGWT